MELTLAVRASFVVSAHPYANPQEYSKPVLKVEADSEFPKKIADHEASLVFSSRYEELKHQLELAQEAAHEEDEEAELARATAAVARLTAPAAISDTDVRLAEELTNVAAPKNRRALRPRVSRAHAVGAWSRGPTRLGILAAFWQGSPGLSFDSRASAGRQ